jgi:hypothetical protein
MHTLFIAANNRESRNQIARTSMTSVVKSTHRARRAANELTPKGFALGFDGCLVLDGA